jgi:hypothetical protein
MTRAAVFSDLASEFDNFLFAPIREDKHGMLLSVVSALARLDVDPWEEAAKLAAMPGEAATQRLSALLASLPTEPASDPERRTIAARLVALLPRRPVAAGSPVKNAPRAAALSKSPTVTYAIYYVIFMLFILLTQWLMGSHQAPAQIGEVSTPSSATAPPPVPEPPRSSSP